MGHMLILREKKWKYWTSNLKGKPDKNIFPYIPYV